MQGWRFSWRAAAAWIGASVVTGWGFSLLLSALNLWASPTEADSFITTWAVLGAYCAVVFAVFGGLFLVVVSVAARLTRWPRPWTEAALAAAICFALTHIGNFIVLSIDTPNGELSPGDHPAGYITAHIAPIFAGALFALSFWLLAGKPRGG